MISICKKVEAEVFCAYHIPEASRSHQIIGIHLIMKAVLITLNFFKVVNYL